ncbi:hypothetical protein P152DRAFT_481028 [Eremomyces bilateralis CBS 781.70]|uniref:Uncharacterized protein n=1 Tax=Eremomyces bilateralis CBS 781.70 TaxID=1392243 RepID=A0A6G1G7A8_9PEZI|nr:uncharacterized protein P152DRAFT_481028 [Eremomyces bilateralis CBS 781.70]KAF1813821.1 hypothetical protein P152DRAFT_481028 [Eremomyces bilateralis CBS 781.70]
MMVSASGYIQALGCFRRDMDADKMAMIVNEEIVPGKIKTETDHKMLRKGLLTMIFPAHTQRPHARRQLKAREAFDLVESESLEEEKVEEDEGPETSSQPTMQPSSLHALASGALQLAFRRKPIAKEDEGEDENALSSQSQPSFGSGARQRMLPIRGKPAQNE